MMYNNRNNHNSNGGYDSTGRWRSEAWHMDGGTNDEGFHDKYCHECYRVTEHGLTEGCIPCGDRAVALRSRQEVRSVIVAGSTENHTVKIYHDGNKHCSCKGFQFRKTCSHIKKAV
jgi:hypothetical protein